MNKQTAKPVPDVQSDIPFPDKTYYLKREWVSEADVPDIPKETFYFVVRDGDGIQVAIFGYYQAAFTNARQQGANLLWAH